MNRGQETFWEALKTILSPVIVYATFFLEGTISVTTISVRAESSTQAVPRQNRNGGQLPTQRFATPFCQAPIGCPYGANAKGFDRASNLSAEDRVAVED